MIIGVTTTKGGAGKTTTTLNIAVGLAHRGYEVCIIDADEGQFSALKWASYREDDVPHIAVMRVHKDKLNREALALAKKYDAVLIDGRPTLSEVGDRIVMASDMVIIPIMPSAFDLESFQEYIPRYQEVRKLKQDFGGTVTAYALLNGLVSSSNISNEVSEAVAQISDRHDDVHMLQTKLMRRVSYSSSPTSGLGVIEETDKKATEEVNALIDELMSITKLSKTV